MPFLVQDKLVSVVQFVRKHRTLYTSTSVIHIFIGNRDTNQTYFLKLRIFRACF